METEILMGLASAPIVAALLQVAKPTLSLPTRFTPAAALILGVAWNLGVRAGELTDISWASAAMLGVMAGLSAGGFYSAVKSTAAPLLIRPN